MPKCRNCNNPISRLDKEICHFCGVKDPLLGEDTSTKDFTQAFDPLSVNIETVKPKSKKKTAILAFTLGFLGAHMFYIGQIKTGIIIALVSLLFIAGLGCLLFFTGAIANVLAFLIPYFVVELAMIICGIFILRSNDLCDARGEFLR